MADDFDLYGDLQLEEVTVAPTPNRFAACPWRKPPCEQQKTSAGPDDTGEQDDNEAMQSLLRLLHAAQESGLDAELEEDEQEDLEEKEVAGRAADDATFLLSTAEDAASPALKRPRLDSERRQEPRAQAEASDDAFDFEAELPSGAGGGALATAGRKAREPGGKARPDGGRAQPEYWFNPATSRWEARDAAKEAALLGERGARGKGAAKGGAGRAKRSGPAPGYKTDLCWQFSRGCCRKAERCFWAHGEAELRSGSRADAETLKRRVVAECAAEARSDARGNVCEYPQALVVRLALRFEDKPGEMLTSMAQAGLPTGADQRSTVKAMLRLCHPDKCRHPEAKKAVQVLGPLLGRKP